MSFDQTAWGRPASCASCSKPSGRSIQIFRSANVRTLDEIQAHSMAQTSFAMVMLAIAASVALLLAVVGVYGVVSYIAAERTHEIGIRMALGAQTGDVRALFLRHGLALTLAGSCWALARPCS